ncbi:tetraacyldisaccharide 4'-kinase [Variovorax sp. PCZ-1]|uniref:tetraacyldisaccharide 4'-kinase n=1 Tax=Variovorax sp. PCZ-1 TaxID=2835533 RepID=UPI001BCEC012|nr:tetraacyldisaccharide 4'-kinase [Variovorax sp. PCZ-1]MBS7808356.1 tetraacyldisaccharide 4'-kinase [Variovorax sp. PCZ-1]
MNLSQRLQKSWYSSKKDWLSLLFLDVSWVYGGLIKLRRKLYASGVMHSTRIPAPVIVIGNVIAGGAGKTPIVMALAKLLQDQGWQPGIVSRGYGRKSGSVIEVLADTPVTESGDEPALMRSVLTAPIFVGKDRTDAASALLAAHPQTDVILCDDGLQHLALQRDIEICVFEERGIGNGRLLPAGPLREPWPREVDFILHRGGFEAGFHIERRLADHAVHPDGTRIPLTDLAQHDLTALAGIANPESFFSMLRERGLNLKETLPLPDHYDFSSTSRTFHQGEQLICTEKDAVKLWKTPLAQQCTILAVPLQVHLPDTFTTALLEKLSSLKPPMN